MKLQSISTSNIKSPGIIKGIITALVISLMVGIASLLLSGFIVQTTLFSFVLYAATLAYLIYLLKNSSARIGRVVVISSWAVISMASWLFDVPLITQVLIQAGSIWLVRSLYFHTSLLTALLDLGLVSVGLAASAWAMVNTGSLATAVWSFFLTQALFCWIPDLSRKPSSDPYKPQPEQTSFQYAHRIALDAVHKLTQS
jgi:hypothetical protein